MSRNRIVNPLIFVLATILTLTYWYLAAGTITTVIGRILLAIPFFFVFIVPVAYWFTERKSHSQLDDFIHIASYLSMGWLNFFILLAVGKDIVSWLAGTLGPIPLLSLLVRIDTHFVVVGSFIAVGIGWMAAMRGPRVRAIDIAIPDLHPDLEGFRIVQISDLHVGSTIGRSYVRKVVSLAEQLAPDLVALTGDIVDGTVEKLHSSIEPINALGTRCPVYFVPGNHEYYAGVEPWNDYFIEAGFVVLANSHQMVRHRNAIMMIAGVLDPAAGMFGLSTGPEPSQARAVPVTKSLDLKEDPAANYLRILLAHNPKIAPVAARAGFDLQLSGHTHAGQFFPWTLAVKRVHAPHVAGLSAEGRMKVYVSTGTGTWGPPIRLGTEPELTLIRLVRG